MPHPSAHHQHSGCKLSKPAHVCGKQTTTYITQQLQRTGNASCNHLKYARRQCWCNQKLMPGLIEQQWALHYQGGQGVLAYSMQVQHNVLHVLININHCMPGPIADQLGHRRSTRIPKCTTVTLDSSACPHKLRASQKAAAGVIWPSHLILMAPQSHFELQHVCCPAQCRGCLGSCIGPSLLK